MKKIVILLLVVCSLSCSSQDSVLLRLNYEKGSEYLVQMDMIQDMGAMGMLMNMKMDMSMKVADYQEEVFSTEMKITKLAMNMNQGGVEMSFDTDMKEEDLDMMGKQMKAQFTPMMAVVIHSKTNQLGKVLSTETKPNYPGMDQITNQSSNIEYPEKALIVGDSWTVINEVAEATMTITYEIKGIEPAVVLIGLTGVVSGGGKGDISGELTVDKKTGILLKTKMNTELLVQGQKTSSKVNMTMKKVN
jgi:hypothetical protein